MSNVDIPVVNTHVHFPPNFSAFITPEEVVEAAVSQNVSALGISNFYDQSIYEWFTKAASKAGVLPLFGLEFITLDPLLEEEGIRINDPANPGRMYLCGKGIGFAKARSALAEDIAVEIRQGNDERAEKMVSQLAQWFHLQGVNAPLTRDSIQARVAARAGVPTQWVSLQERHIAAAFAEIVGEIDADTRRMVLERLYGKPSEVDVADVAALQGEIRSNLLKVGTPGFAPEVPLKFAVAYRYILEMGGIPTYPTLADGVNPICPFEVTATDLAGRLLDRGIYAAELIPIRNTSEVVDEYVRAFRGAGLIVMAGTEHNTPERIPLDPACLDGPMSEFARQAFWEGTCVVAAHQDRVQAGLTGFVDDKGDRTQVSERELMADGAKLISGE